MKNKLQRHGYHLMSLASIGQLACICLWILEIAVLFSLTGPAVKVGARTLSNGQTVGFVILATSLFIAQVWALQRLHQIGGLLWQGVTISHGMAQAWRRFGRAVVATGVLSMLPVRAELNSAGGIDMHGGLDSGGFFFLLICALCVFSIARILEEAAALKDDAQSIV